MLHAPVTSQIEVEKVHTSCCMNYNSLPYLRFRHSNVPSNNTFFHWRVQISSNSAEIVQPREVDEIFRQTVQGSWNDKKSTLQAQKSQKKKTRRKYPQMDQNRITECAILGKRRKNLSAHKRSFFKVRTKVFSSKTEAEKIIDLQQVKEGKKSLCRINPSVKNGWVGRRLN